MTKRIANMLLVITILLNCSISVMADTEKELEKSQAVQVLEMLNIIKGYEDNTLKLDEYITRAEMMTIIIRTIGLEEAASYSNIESKKRLNRIFRDVSIEHWANQYIQIAHTLSLTKGVGDHRFNPDSNITYQDAVTMLLRALGYEFHVSKIGEYPYAYLSVAKDIGVIQGVEIEADSFVKRSDAMKLVFNSLTIDIMQQVSGLEPKWIVTDESILTGKLYIEKNYGKVDSIKEDYVYINDKKYRIGPTDAEKYVGLVVSFCYIENEKEEKILIILEKDEDNSIDDDK